MQHLNGPFISSVFGGSSFSYTGDGGYSPSKLPGTSATKQVRRFGDDQDYGSEDQTADAIKGNKQKEIQERRTILKNSMVKAAIELAPLAGPLATPEDLVPGAKVIHQAFGEGEVINTEGDLDGNGQRYKVQIKFAGIEEPKKLMFRFARLVLKAGIE